MFQPGGNGRDGALSEPVVYATSSPPPARVYSPLPARLYGSDAQFAALLAHMAALVDGEPAETFASPAVCRAACHLVERLAARADRSETGE